MIKILVIIDPQYDFLDPRGSMYVKNNNLTYNIHEYALKNNFDEVIVTLDNHPVNHCSFNTQGGKFPIHCLKGSKGASYDGFIEDMIIKKSAIIVEKGSYSDLEEFGAFNISVSYEFDDYTLPEASWGDTMVYICGVAGDYCVKETIKNIIDTSLVVDCNHIVVLKDLIVSTDDGSVLNKFIEEECLKIE